MSESVTRRLMDQDCFVACPIPVTTHFFFLTVVPWILMLSGLLFYPTDAQLYCSKIMLKFTLKFRLKCTYMFCVTTIIRELHDRTGFITTYFN